MNYQEDKKVFKKAFNKHLKLFLKDRAYFLKGKEDTILSEMFKLKDQIEVNRDNIEKNEVYFVVGSIFPILEAEHKNNKIIKSIQEEIIYNLDISNELYFTLIQPPKEGDDVKKIMEEITNKIDLHLYTFIKVKYLSKYYFEK
jgi:hypothetical protein